MSKAIGRIAGAMNRDSEQEMHSDLSKAISEMFGAEKVELIESTKYGESRSKLIDYLSNTKRPYVDNQLSEYSSFPELIEYWQSGYKSCSIVPVVAAGKFVAILSMRSKTEGFFREQMMSGVSDVAYIIGLAVTLRSEEAKSKRLAEYFNSAFSLPLPQMIVEGNGRIVRMNPECKRLGGYSEGHFLDLKGLAGVEIESVSNSRKPVIISIGAKDRFYRIDSVSIGNGLFYLSIMDVTSDYMLDRLKSVMDERFGAGLMFLDNGFVITKASESMKLLTGYESSLLEGKVLLDIIPDRDRGRLKEKLSGLKSVGMKATDATGFSTIDGTISNVRYSIVRTESGYLFAFYDANSEQYFSAMERAMDDFIDSSSDMAIRIDGRGIISYANHAVDEILGYSKNEIEGREIREIYLDGTTLDRDLGHVRNGGTVNNSYAMLLAKDGRRIEVVNSARVFIHNRTVEYLIIAKELETKRHIRDIEERVAQLDSIKKKLEAEGELKSQFIYNISHELKTPLTNIIGFSKLLYTGEFGDLNRDQLDHISTIISETNRLLDMIKQVLDAAKLDSVKMKLEYTEVDLNEIYHVPTIRALEESAREKGLDFTWSVGFDVPLINVDRGRLIQVFVNLIGNAIKFTSTGAIHVKIVKKGSKVECSVSDTGIGIADDDKKRLFRKFFDVQKKGRLKQEGSGTGLGLAITKGIVTLHKGKIWYEPNNGGGSTFTFSIPIKPSKNKKKPSSD
jgi:PAS domain S-box-containing protein